MDKAIFLQKLQRAWELHGGNFCDFMGDAVYHAEGHSEIVLSNAERLTAVFDKVIADGEWKPL